MSQPRTFYDKIWADHVVDEQPDGTALLYIDRHIVHEVTSPQAFEGLRNSGRKVHAPDKTLLVVDHNVPTTDRNLPNPDKESADQIAYLAENAKFFNLEYYDEFDIRQEHLPRHRPGAGLHAARRDLSFAATAIPQRTARSARSPMASAPPRSSMCSPRSRWCRSSRRTCAPWSKAICRRP